MMIGDNYIVLSKTSFKVYEDNVLE